MGLPSPAIAESRDRLRVVACGAAGDGKSTLIARLMAGAGAARKDQPAAPIDVTREPSQNISTDAVCCCFSTPNRDIAVTDCSGQQHSMRAMAAGAANADLAIVVIDVRGGVTAQTMLHSRAAALLGVGEVLLVVNKMDLADFAESAFDAAVSRYKQFAKGLAFRSVTAIPAAALAGENVSRASSRMPWYKGPSVLGYLETAAVESSAVSSPFRFVVQNVNNQKDGARGHAGKIISGSIAPGDRVVALPSGPRTSVAAVLREDGESGAAQAGQAVTIILADRCELSPGDMIADAGKSPDVTDQFAAHLIWFGEAPMLPGRNYVLRAGAQTVPVTITSLKHKVDIETGDKRAGRVLEPDEIGFCNLATVGSVIIDPHAVNRDTGAFILLDQTTGEPVGAGTVSFSLRRASNVQWQYYQVDKTVRGRMKAQRPCIVWFTGLPGAGKSTIMNLVEQKLVTRGAHTYALDGDNLRHRLNHDLGFTESDRVENIRRAGEVARLMMDAGLIVLCAFISPFHADRKMVREFVGQDEFIEVFIDASLETCIARDPKGLYKKALAGQIQNMTGIQAPYERPLNPNIHLDTTSTAAEILAERVVEALAGRQVFLS
jgi:bifunctional enzyme CysN/CysC